MEGADKIGHLLKQVSLLEVEGIDVQHGHITCAFDKDGVMKCTCCGRTSLRGYFPRFCRETCTRSNRGLNRRELLNHAMDEETWHNEREKHRQQRGRQEFVLRTSASSVMTTAASGICEAEKSQGGKCATSWVKQGTVGG